MKNIKRFDESSIWSRIFNRESKKKSFVPKKYSIFNVDVFNEWWNDKDNDATYAHPGIFLRLDKLSKSHIEDYLVKCHNIDLNEWDLDEEIDKFYEDIRLDWKKKLNS